MSQRSSRIANFFRMKPAERIDALVSGGWLEPEDAALLRSGQHTLTANGADKMIENVIGVFGLPIGVALNFVINGEDRVLPLAVEEPSIVAGLSGIGKLARAGGGFQANAPAPLISGQVQLVGLSDAGAAEAEVQRHRQDIIDAANASQPNMVARGGGVIELHTQQHIGPASGEAMLVVYLTIDSRDAMGANMVNSLCEAVAPRLEQITRGRAVLRILSNLTDRSIARASVEIPTSALAGRGMTGEAVRDGIVMANDLALVDPYRATTHNKGIMNGVDAIVVATGNDWRAIESGAHAYAARDGQYRALTQWRVGDSGALVGDIEIPIKVGTVGGSLQSNPTVAIAHRLLGNPGASELAGIIGVVGLAQNLAALRSLATNGIQQNHMKLHARSVASTAEVPEHLFEAVVEGLISSGEIKVWKAQALLEELQSSAAAPSAADDQSEVAAGKLILLGEHAVVYGEPALAVPVPLALSARAVAADDSSRLRVPAWQVDIDLSSGEEAFAKTLRRIMSDHGVALTASVEVDAQIRAGMGLGGSAALAVSVLRALATHHKLAWDDARINALAYELEKVAHGNPSGIDNTLATYRKPLRYQRHSDGEGQFSPLAIGKALPLVIGFSDSAGATAETVAHVRGLVEAHPDVYQPMIREVGRLATAAEAALRQGNLLKLGALMNANQGLLNALGVSTPELEKMIHIARDGGAIGAKLTGGGGGGCMIALAADEAAQLDVASALERAGYQTLASTIT